MEPINSFMNDLQSGNQRFLDSQTTLGSGIDSQRRQAVADRQAPFAAVIACADSRVPVELIFDQGVGDLFVIRVAGNLATSSIIGSVEFAVQALGTQLVIVMGHTSCGAVAATCDALQAAETALSPGLTAIVEAIAPAIQAAESELGPSAGREDLLAHAGRANVRHQIEQLLAGSDLLREKAAAGEIAVAAAEYDLATGRVDFF